MIECYDIEELTISQNCTSYLKTHLISSMFKASILLQKREYVYIEI